MFLVSLYAIGGADGQCPLNSVERYDPQKNTWTLMAPMSTRRKHLGSQVFNNMIYAVGGRDDCTELSSAERYNPATNTWSPIVAMMSRRSGVCYSSYNTYQSQLPRKFAKLLTLDGEQLIYRFFIVTTTKKICNPNILLLLDRVFSIQDKEFCKTFYW